jgi:hypothetical protein
MKYQRRDNMKNKLIPNNFVLGGSTISVELVKNDLGTNVGQIILPTGKIYVATNFRGEDCNIDYMEASFYHELVHGILDILGKHDLSSNEEFVEAFSNLLHQFEKTKK